MKRGIAATVVIVLAGSLPAVPAAWAQDGIIVDPDSAPAKEYALPLNAAREQATGEEPSPERAAAAVQAGEAPPPPPAFGAGVEPQQPRRARPKRTDKPAARERRRAEPKTPIELVAPSDRLVAVDAGGPVVAVSAVAGLAVILTALMLAAGARRIRPRSG